MIKLREKIGYGFGDMSSSMFWKLFGSYLMIFYTDVFGLSAAVVGTMFLVTRLWDSFFDPIVGVIADRTQTRWGKFRPYILYLGIPFALIGILTFTTPDLSNTGRIVYAYITYSLMMMVYSGINVPYASLLGVMSSDVKERNILSTYRMTFAYIGSFIALLLFMPMANFFGEG
ncbi:MAG: MFS transporter, partial [Bacteroidaceae bacterium]